MNLSEFDDYAKNYRERIDHKIRRLVDPSGNYFIELKAKLLNQFIDVSITNKKDDSINILDFGCGLGDFCQFLQSENRRIFGLDISFEMINYAQNNNHFAGVFFFQANGDNIPFGNNMFDVVFASCVFHHINKRHYKRIISEMKRVCKKNGIVVIFEHNPNNLFTQFVVRTTPIDRNAKLLNRNLLIEILKKYEFLINDKGFFLFGPKMIDSFIVNRFPKILKTPLGGQYYISATNK